VIVGVLALALVAAVLVPYLSNKVQADITVNSPIALQIGTTLGVWESDNTVNFPPIIGGETVHLYVSTENKASAPVTGTMWNVVSNPDGVTCNDFDASASVLNYDSPYAEMYTSTIIGCEAINLESVRLITTNPEPWTWAEGHKDIASITIVFEEAAHGTYSLSTQVVPSL
jgi:hypothetical protein